MSLIRCLSYIIVHNVTINAKLIIYFLKLILKYKTYSTDVPVTVVYRMYMNAVYQDDNRTCTAYHEDRREGVVHITTIMSDN